MGLFFTSDTHFGHANTINYCHRPFNNVDEMDEALIANWNSVVSNDDIIYHLGDFAWRNKKKAREIVSRLNGRKFLCRGSHDGRTSKLAGFFEDVQDSFLIAVNGRQYIFMSHCLHKVWPKSHYGSWHLFGHSHGNMDAYAEREGKLLDVGVDSHNFRPWSLQEIAQVMATRPLNFNDSQRKDPKRGGEEC